MLPTMPFAVTPAPLLLRRAGCRHYFSCYAIRLIDIEADDAITMLSLRVLMMSCHSTE